MYHFADTYQFGVLEGFREHGFRPKVEVKQLGNLADADFELRW